MRKKSVMRHGDLALVKINKLPGDVKKKKMPTAATEIIRGSRGNPHLVVNGVVYFKDADDYVFGYLEAKMGCVLLHKEHGEKVKGRRLREANVAPGVYELRKQVEETHEGMRPVID